MNANYNFMGANMLIKMAFLTILLARIELEKTRHNRDPLGDFSVFT